MVTPEKLPERSKQAMALTGQNQGRCKASAGPRWRCVNKEGCLTRKAAWQEISRDWTHPYRTTKVARPCWRASVGNSKGVMLTQRCNNDDDNMTATQHNHMPWRCMAKVQQITTITSNQSHKILFICWNNQFRSQQPATWISQKQSTSLLECSFLQKNFELFFTLILILISRSRMRLLEHQATTN